MRVISNGNFYRSFPENLFSGSEKNQHDSVCEVVATSREREKFQGQTTSHNQSWSDKLSKTESGSTFEDESWKTKQNKEDRKTF